MRCMFMKILKPKNRQLDTVARCQLFRQLINNFGVAIKLPWMRSKKHHLKGCCHHYCLENVRHCWIICKRKHHIFLRTQIETTQKVTSSTMSTSTHGRVAITLILPRISRNNPPDEKSMSSRCRVQDIEFKISRKNLTRLGIGNIHNSSLEQNASISSHNPSVNLSHNWGTTPSLLDHRKTTGI